MVDQLPTTRRIEDFTGAVWWADALDLLAALPDASVDSVISDIPYGEVNRASGGIRKLDKGNADAITFDIDKLANEIARVTKSWACLFVSTEQTSPLRAAWQQYGMTRLLIWKKPNPSPLNCEYIWLSDIECCVVLRKSGAPFNRFYESSVLEFDAGSSKTHPTQKPLPLISYLVESVTSNGEIVLDPFAGSCTTAIACLNLDRRYICADLHLEYVIASRERIQRHDPFTASPLANGMKQRSLFEWGE